MSHCPCCTGKLLRHVRTSGIYWFCPTCHQEMPNLPLEMESDHRTQFDSGVASWHLSRSANS